MKNPKDPVQQLTDTLTLLRVEIADVKSRQITEKQLKHLHTALEKTTGQVEKVTESAEAGAERGTARLASEVAHTTQKIEEATQRAIRGLSEALSTVHGSYLSRKRMIYLLLLFSTFSGVALGAFLAVRAGDYKMAKAFGKSIQGPEAEWYCEQAGGQIYVPEGGPFCGILIFK